MANKIQVKRSAVPSKVPTTTDLDLGEIAINTYDGKMYIKKDDGTPAIIQIGAGGAGTGDVVGPGSATDNAITRYDGTTGKLIQNSSVTLDDNGNIQNLNGIAFDTTPTSFPTAAGAMYWDSGNGTPSVVLNADATLQLGQENIALVYNGTGSTITNGSVVAVNGAQGQRPSVVLADADSESLSAGTLGIATQDIANGAEGFVCTFGLVRGLDTSTFTAGDPIWLSQTAGQFTKTRPAAPAHSVFMGWVIKVNASSGEVFVHISNGWELDELHNVLISSPQSGNTLIYDGTAGVWKNANLTDGTGITITEGAGTITIANSGVTSVSAGTGINVSASTGSVTITNSAPDQTVTLTAGSGINITGTYPSFTVASTVTDPIPSGTAMLFVQTTAPVGWTKVTTHNNKALRVVSGTASSGGSVEFTTAFSSARSVTVSGSVANTTAGGSVSTSVTNTTAGGTVSTTVNNTTATGSISTSVDNTTATGTVSTTVANTTATGTVSTTVANTTATGSISTTVDNTTASGSVSTSVANTTAGGSVSLSGGSVANTTAGGSVSLSGGSISNTTATGSISVSGGSVGATTLTTDQMPSHSHNMNATTTAAGSGSAIGVPFGVTQTGLTGGGQSHTHSFTNPTASFTGTAHAHTLTNPTASFTGTTHGHTLTLPTASFTGTTHGHTATSTFTGTSHGHTASSSFTGTAHNHTATSSFSGTAHNHTATSSFSGTAHNHTASSTFTGTGHDHTASSTFSGTTHGHTASSTFTGDTHGHSFSGSGSVDLDVQYVDVIIATKD